MHRFSDSNIGYCISPSHGKFSSFSLRFITSITPNFCRLNENVFHSVFVQKIISYLSLSLSTLWLVLSLALWLVFPLSLSLAQISSAVHLCTLFLWRFLPDLVLESRVWALPKRFDWSTWRLEASLSLPLSPSPYISLTWPKLKQKADKFIHHFT